MSEQACKTPLIDLLIDVPATLRVTWETQWAEDGTPTGHAMCPIGNLCHEAADRIAELEANRKASCIAFAQWFRSGNNRHGRTENECWEFWLAEREKDDE